MSSSIQFIIGTNGKPAATEALISALTCVTEITGTCQFGAPFIVVDHENKAVDAVLVSPEIGVVIFDLIETETIRDDIASYQDALYLGLEATLKSNSLLSRNRSFLPKLEVVSFAPLLRGSKLICTSEEIKITNEETLAETLSTLPKLPSDEENASLYEKVLSSVQNLSSMGGSRQTRGKTRPNSRGDLLRQLENRIATFDNQQAPVVTDTVDGIQRIRGLAGSGKTIVLAAKAAYLHTQNPDWNIAVTFQTRALKAQFKELIERFVIGYKKDAPNWEKLRVLNAWGGSGRDTQDGIYAQYCAVTGQDFLDFQSAKHVFGPGSNYFRCVCKKALKDASLTAPIYDIILVDEAQDLPPEFLQLCYRMVKGPEKRLVYAYDELQNLSGHSLAPPEKLFGENEFGRPNVSLKDARRQDIILKRCYRNSRPVLTTAHALGFGIYRSPPPNTSTGLVQMFGTPELWMEIGYKAHTGDLVKGMRVSLIRSPDASPEFLELPDSPDSLVMFEVFKTIEEQNKWVVDQIGKNITEDELRADDIIVISTDRYRASEKLGQIRSILFERGIQSHTAGVDSDPNKFFLKERASITCTGIHRAKGNEAGMVYIIGAQDYFLNRRSLAAARNILFTAITRSKAWVRVVGVGPEMQTLKDEYERLLSEDYALSFIYPDEETLTTLRQTYGTAVSDNRNSERWQKIINQLHQEVKEGKLSINDLSPDDRETLRKFLETDRS